MDVLRMTRLLFEHVAWADRLLLDALLAVDPPPAEAWREYAHILGAESVWIDRLVGRPQRIAIWPELTTTEVRSLADSLRDEYARYLEALDVGALDARVPYVNSAGRAFDGPVADILLQVALHGQYHRGKINLLLRQGGHEPAPTDYISFARGVPAATTARAAS
jgi:uncharacterized damage-inducible protein DinB